MIKITTVHIHSGIHKAASEHAKNSAIKGGFSGYVELLIKDNLKKNNIDWRKFTDDNEEDAK